MIGGGWRRIGALVTHEAGAACARIDSWVARWVLGAGSSAIVLAAASFGYLEEALRLLGFGIYLVLIWLLPWITLGALRERRRGRVELLAASPLGDRQVFVALVGARFLSAVHVLVGVAPAFMVLAWGAGAAGAVGAAGDMICVLAAAWLATSYAALQAVRGVRESTVWARLVVFVTTATPLAAVLGATPGDGAPVAVDGKLSSRFSLLRPLLVVGVTSIVIRLFDVEAVAAVLIGGAFPFWTLGYCLLGGWSAPAAAAALGVIFVLGMVLSLETARLFPVWLRDVKEVDAREGASYRGRGSSPAPRTPASPPAESKADSYPRRRLASIRGLARVSYRLSRRNAYVVREILREDYVGAVLGVLLLLFLGIAWHMNEMGLVSPERADAGALAAAFGLVPCCFLCALEGSRAIPARGTTAMEVLLSTPLGGWRIVSGSVLATFLRFRVALIFFLGMGFLTPVGLHAARGPAFLLLGASLLALAHGVGVWTRFLGPSRGGGAPIVLCVCATLGVGTAAFWPEGAPAHPLRAWYSRDAAPIYLSGAMTCAAALFLCGTLAVRLRRIAARRL